mgnify:CR=1 FL=1
MAKKNKKTPLKQIQFDGPDLKNDIESAVGLDQFSLDKIAGLGASAISAKPVDNKATDDYLAQIEKPTGGSVYDKMAARYRSQGEGAVLRTQKGLANLFQPTITLIKEREAAAQARFTLLKSKMPEFDNSTIFGHQSIEFGGQEMPIVAEIESISKTTKEDMRMLSRLSPNDERYDEIKKRVDKNQDAIVNFDNINKKLLEIRNSQDGREDESQWSAGMDQTTIDMWRDIYSSKGENIKIQDGKLVWTDTRGTTSYDFEPHIYGGSRVDAKYTALGGYNTVLGRLAAYTRDDDGEQRTFENGEKSDFVNFVQRGLIKGGFTDADGNELDEDGEWGPKSQAAYDKYLEQKDGLEKAWLDENLPEDSKFRKTTGTGETKTIDLSQIGEGPTLISNEGTNMDIVIQGEVQKFIEMNGKVDDPTYNQMIKAKLNDLNKIGPQGLKSLIFDGIGLEDDDMFTGSKTDSFIEKVIADNYADGDISKLSAEEIEGHIQQMKSGDVTVDYNTGEIDPITKIPIKSTLQSQFMKWDKGEVDKKITEGKKSKVVRSATGGGSGNYRSSNNQSSNNQSGSGDLSKTGVHLTYGVRGSVKATSGNKTLGGFPLETGEISITQYDVYELISSKDESLRNTFFKIGLTPSSSTEIKIGNDNEIYKWNDVNSDWEIISFDENNPKELQIKNEIFTFAEDNTEGSLNYKPSDTDFKYMTRLEFMKENGFILDENGNQIQGRTTIDLETDNIEIMNDNTVVDNLNQKYGHLGFEFSNPSNFKDSINVSYKYKTGNKKGPASMGGIEMPFDTFSTETNFASGDKDKAAAQRLQEWMQSAIAKDNDYWNTPMKIASDGGMFTGEEEDY